MSWAFWRDRKDEVAATARASEAADAVRDPAAELRARTRRRLIGAAALLLAAVIVLPMLLDSTPRPVDPVAIDIPSDKTPFTPGLTPPTRNGATTATQATRTAPAPGKAVEPPAPPAEKKPIEEAPAGTDAAAKESAPAAKSPEKTVAAGASSYALQAAALASETSARELVAKLKKAGFAAYTEKVGTRNGERIRVRVGPYATREDAEAVRTKLKALGIQASVVTG